MIGLSVSFVVKEDKVEEFVTRMRDLIKDVHAKEPGCKTYEIFKAGRDATNKFQMIELYADQDAFRAHGQTDHFKSKFPAVQELLVEPPVLIRGETV